MFNVLRKATDPHTGALMPGALVYYYLCLGQLVFNVVYVLCYSLIWLYLGRLTYNVCSCGVAPPPRKHMLRKRLALYASDQAIRPR